MQPTTRTAPGQAIGTGYTRIDGPLKVSGEAKYTSDYHFPGMLYAVPVCSTIAAGRIAALDTTAAEAMPGVHAILHRGNTPPLFRKAKSSMADGKIDETRPPFEDDLIRYYGQYIALAVADQYEQAVAAANAVRVNYSTSEVYVSGKLSAVDKAAVKSERGDAQQAFDSASVKIDEEYVTPVETHNPIELHASVALWDGESYTLYETTQSISNHQTVMSEMLGAKKENVRVISHFLGSGFGGKLWPWPHSLMAAAAAKKLGKPIKLVVERSMMFQNVGHRALTQQRIRLGASNEGVLQSIQHDYLNHTSILDKYTENCGEATPHMYRTRNLRVTSGIVPRNVGTPTSMRGPGAVPGLFALESAMDELAYKVNIDPVKLRIMNEPDMDEGANLPFSSRHLVETLQVGAEKFGWARRTPGVGSMKRSGADHGGSEGGDQEVVVGWGVAACSWLTMRLPTEAVVDLFADGSARVVCGTQDIGTGTYTILAQLVSSLTGIPVQMIRAELGDSRQPTGPLSGGSNVTASITPAVLAATRDAVAKLLAVATAHPDSPFHGLPDAQLMMAEGVIYDKTRPGSDGVSFDKIIRLSRANAISGSGKSDPNEPGAAKKKYSINSYGAHFAEITWEPQTARLRVTRVVTVIDGGKIYNPITARNQIEGAVVMGVGMAIFEATEYDPRTGKPINNNLADYIMTTHADAPHIDVTFLDYPDLTWNELGARGIGEIGLAGIAAAITNAVYHATGVRVRELPVKIEHLLTSA